ncbi:uncharacterized protein LOC124662928 [Lolium rigidum]|uniref:uncharacterized protein LOC124662928 n=1 Tax=Lolium rigidum TaxID=89674 RepID=UPI001F5D7BCD|nr:uncharacterized protein LOC124662928 [Lolium rigidum]
MMDSNSWFHRGGAGGNIGYMCGYAARERPFRKAPWFSPTTRGSTGPSRLASTFGSIGIGQVVADNIAAHKVGSAELSLLAKKDYRGCTDDDLLANGRQLRSFVDACPGTFSCLTRLKLESLVLFPSVFTKICTICKRLDFLHLFNIEMGVPSLLEVQHPQLRELEIAKCSFERVDLNWLPKLTTLTFSYWESTHDPLSVGYAPLLQTVTMSNTALSWHKMLTLSEVLGKATVSDLHLNFESEKIWVKPEGPRELWPVFHKLRFVNLADISEECDLAWTLFILEGAPSLKELCLKIWNRCTMRRDEEERKEYAFSEEKKDTGVEWEGSASKHHNLAVLRIFGFQLEEKFVNYVSGVMESTLNLQDIYLHGRPICETHKCKKRKDRYPWTKKQRISLINCFNMDLHPLLRIHFPSVRRA